MGSATNALLVYGYDLGGGDAEWDVAEVDADGELTPDWAREDEDDDFRGLVETVLLDRLANFTEEWRRGDDTYFDRRKAALAQIGVEVETYQSGSCPIYFLAAHVTSVHRGELEVVDPEDLQRRPTEQGWDAKLRSALDALGLTPKQDQARWMLCSYWGV